MDSPQKVGRFAKINTDETPPKVGRFATIHNGNTKMTTNRKENRGSRHDDSDGPDAAIEMFN